MYKSLFNFVAFSALVINDAVEQSLIINLGRHDFYKHRNRTENIKERGSNYETTNDQNFDLNEYQRRSRFESNKKVPHLETKFVSSRLSSNFIQTPSKDLLPNSLDELKDLLRQMDHVFTNRIETLSQRVDRLESKQNSYKRSIMTEWTALSNTDKHIRLFVTAPSTWDEAKQICQVNSAELLSINSDNENLQINELFKNEFGMNKIEEENLYWIGTQAELSFPIDQQRYNNFKELKTMYLKNNSISNSSSSKIEISKNLEQPTINCVAISPNLDGKWFSRNCQERHGFICQF